MADPGRRAKTLAAAHAAIRGKPIPAEVRAASAQRMRERNPMHNPEAREKMRRSLAGRTFLARGGNGKLTPEQLHIHELTGLPMEYPIPTKAVRDRFESLPNCYKVDLADPTRHLAIEIDGLSHRQKLWRFLDARKTEVLIALGWSVLRFSNAEVNSNAAAVAEKIATFTTSA